MSVNKYTVRVVILNYNGEDLLPRCLHSVVDAAFKSRHAVAVTVLNNPGPNSGLEYVRNNFPSVEIVELSENRILCSYNDYLPKIKEDIAILLNNDIRVASDFIDPLVERFGENPKTFLVAPRVMSFDGSKVEAADSRGRMRFGLFWNSARYPGYEKNIMKFGATFSSGFGAFDRERFLELNGYDDIYMPGIFEDVDLCYRAKQAGYDLFYEPKSVVFHIGQATFKEKHGSKGLTVLAYRNNFLFLWKNFSGWKFWISHVFWVIVRIFGDILRLKTSLVQGLTQAISIKGKIRK